MQYNLKRKLSEVLRDLDLNLSSNPQGTDKGDFKSYVRGFYEAEFGCRQSENNRVLEIGVRTGASLALWANFFENAEIIGVDVEAVGSQVGPVRKYLDYPSIKFFCDDAYSHTFAKSVVGNFSIMIDDGPHSLASQKRFLELYLPKLDEDGVLIIEDVQRAYRDSFQLMRMLPENMFLFETYDFRSWSRTGDDFLFVVRHNKSGESQAARKAYLAARCMLGWLAIPFRRVKALLLRGRWGK